MLHNIFNLKFLVELFHKKLEAFSLISSPSQNGIHRTDRLPKSTSCQTNSGPRRDSQCFTWRNATQASWLQMWAACYFLFFCQEVRCESSAPPEGHKSQCLDKQSSLPWPPPVHLLIFRYDSRREEERKRHCCFRSLKAKTLVKKEWFWGRKMEE